LVAPAPLDTNPAALLETRRAIGGVLDTSKDGNTRRVLTQAKQDVDALLASSVPGIKEIDAKRGSLAQAKANVDVGQTALDSGRESLHPTEPRAKLADANTPIGTEMGPQALALTQGARAEIDRIVGTNLNDRAALNSLVKGEGDWNNDRLSTLFGKEKTDRTYKVLDNEHTMAQTENLALANSKTAAIQAAQKEVQMTPAGPGVLQPALDMKTGSALKRLKDLAWSGVAQRRQANLNDDIANVIMGSGPLKPDTVGKSAMTPAMLNAIMRPDEVGTG
jgi:hypothetical protein